ncbi:hypothetical protein RHGRI_011176 [Rhododendron griersonianum]|uniref:Uncharacterized protein n=1 Tax=Rhododendron griersonianum TaxID=479676 RepID=A0AAV6KL24_9ERIC|nr:hypothetical protein RHGRI_011176 [Rhododendron griersonianum]
MLLHLVMDKSWMKLGSTAHGRTSQPYFDGVNSFLEYAAAVGDRQDANQWESCAGLGKIIEVEAEHAEVGVTPITQEKLSIKSLKAKSGYVKGLDWICRRSAAVSPASSLIDLLLLSKLALCSAAIFC